jgi:2-polyprenyl-3-methyl-5-hydroxy-6-metoxy-1,4-benzoquinol methylase
MTTEKFITDPKAIYGDCYQTNKADFADYIAWNDHKVSFVIRHAEGRKVLDLGCVDHDPAAYESKFWVHKALVEKAQSVVGMDLSEEGTKFLRSKGYNVIFGDAQNFDLNDKFDIIVAGDLIEHLENFNGFIDSCKKSLAPGGSILISTPNPWYWRNVVKSIISVEVENHPEHTCWLCPRTLRQLVARHGMSIADIEFGSRYRRDYLMPLPRGIKHTSWHARVFVKD